MARLPYPSRDAMPVELSDVLSGLPRNNISEMLAHAESLTEPFLRTARANFTSLELSARQRELVILAVAGLVQCEYEFVQHVPMFESVGIDVDLRDRVREGDFEAPQDPAERVLLRFVASVVRQPHMSGDVFDAMSSHFTARQIVEVLQLVGFYWGIGRLCTVLEVELDVPEGLESIAAVANMAD